MIKLVYRTALKFQDRFSQRALVQADINPSVNDPLSTFNALFYKYYEIFKYKKKIIIRCCMHAQTEELYRKA